MGSVYLSLYVYVSVCVYVYLPLSSELLLIESLYRSLAGLTEFDSLNSIELGALFHSLKLLLLHLMAH
jgi:hypothetical protein